MISYRNYIISFMAKTGHVAVVFFGDKHRPRSEVCYDEYVKYLVQIIDEYSNFDKKDCKELCKECEKIYENIYKLKRSCLQETSPFAESDVEQQLRNYCKRCDGKCEKSGNMTCCNEEKVSSKLKAPERYGSPEGDEKHISSSELRAEYEDTGNKQQGTLNTPNLDKHKFETFSSIINKGSTTPIKTQIPPASFSVSDESLTEVINTYGDAEHVQIISGQDIDSDGTQEEGDLDKDIIPSNAQAPQGNAKKISGKKCYKTVKEISNAVQFFYKTFVFALLSIIYSHKSVNNHLQSIYVEKVFTSMNSASSNRAVNNNLSPKVLMIKVTMAMELMNRKLFKMIYHLELHMIVYILIITFTHYCNKL
ncbi:variable surface protein [Plasmodium gonderi]|uniref:Variable surface protein n=1 Tax=Plasmodium gonderi TaxID=77519 RepID=A0A1Y1JND8_PLAGO|nr:variable surface protein [Plasmodium gonderi]GAW83981.1 variable surface protein [Plasmodium gonderi]